ncbi:MAG: hypothetical protein AAGD86_09875 [Pseudomonadota bacterium]
MDESPRKKPHSASRRVFATQEEAVAAVIDVAACARRTLDIYSPTLDPLLYEGMEFLSQVKRLILGQSYARVRALLQDPTPAVRRGHRLVEMARHLSSFIELRTASADDEGHDEDFMVADGSAFVYRAKGSRWHGIVDIDGKPVAQRHLELFTEMWERSAPEQEFRRLHL